MANPLTGDFDAVLQVAVRHLNGLLATLHQNGLTSDTTLKLLHSVRVRVGETLQTNPDLDALGDWVLSFERARTTSPRPSVQDLLVTTTPPGASKRFVSSFGDLTFEPVPVEFRGTASIQISTIALSIIPGSTSEVTLHARIRARYEADKGTTPLPTEIFGDVNAVFEIRKTISGGKTRLLIRASAQDQKIQFTPSPTSGMSSTDAARVTTQVRIMLRQGLRLLPVELPGGFPFSVFKGLGSGNDAAIALPLQLSDKPNPPSGAQGLTQSLVGNHGFAFAISQEHVQGLLDIDAIRRSIELVRIRIRFSFLFGGFTVTYRLRFSSGPTLTFVPGAIEVAGRVEVETDNLIAPNGFVKFRQRLTLALDVSTQRVDLEASGDPSVDHSVFIPNGTAVNEVRKAVAKAVELNAPGVRSAFKDARDTLVSALRSFESSASASYEQLEISSDGIIIQGDLSSAGRINPIMMFDETRDGRAFSAFESWVPGGRIDRFIWSWVEYPPNASIWGGEAKSFASTTSFLLEKPAGIREVSQVCLRMTGQRTLPDGGVQNVNVGTTCEVQEPVVVFDAPSWWEAAFVPLWKPDVSPDSRVRDAIAGHLGVQTDRPRQDFSQNTLVVFPEWTSQSPFESLARGLAAKKRKTFPQPVLVILPHGAFDGTRRELEARLAALRPELAKVHVAEDAEGGWARTFDVTKPPALFLINARREFVWKAVGDIDPDKVAAAIDQHHITTPATRFVPHRLRVSVGERAPDAFFQDDQGNEGALHRLLGHRVFLVFWHSSSEPSVAELRRVQTLAANPKEARFIVAFNGGAARKEYEQVDKSDAGSLQMVQDTEHRVAQIFGVRCWPTLIELGPDGIVERIQFGLSEDSGRYTE